MILLTKQYNVEITVDYTYTLNSSDNKYYNYIFKSCKTIDKTNFKAFSIKICNKNKKITIALLGDFYSSCEKCAVINKDLLIILMNNIVSVIDIKHIRLVKTLKVSDYCCFSICPFSNGYIIHGELDIVFINNEFNKEWLFSGRNIFTTSDETDIFEIYDDRIKVKDWEGFIYTIDSNGKLITAIK